LPDGLRSIRRCFKENYFVKENGSYGWNFFYRPKRIRIRKEELQYGI